MNYDEQQGVAYAVGKLYDLLDEYASDEEITKDAIRDLIKELDELGVIKYDFLAITVLEVISNAVESVESMGDSFVKIEDDDGIVKIVPKTYLQNKEIEV